MSLKKLNDQTHVKMDALAVTLEEIKSSSATDMQDLKAFISAELDHAVRKVKGVGASLTNTQISDMDILDQTSLSSDLSKFTLANIRVDEERLLLRSNNLYDNAIATQDILGYDDPAPEIYDFAGEDSRVSVVNF